MLQTAERGVSKLVGMKLTERTEPAAISTPVPKESATQRHVAMATNGVGDKQPGFAR